MELFQPRLGARVGDLGSIAWQATTISRLSIGLSERHRANGVYFAQASSSPGLETPAPGNCPLPGCSSSSTCRCEHRGGTRYAAPGCPTCARRCRVPRRRQLFSVGSSQIGWSWCHQELLMTRVDKAVYIFCAPKHGHGPPRASYGSCTHRDASDRERGRHRQAMTCRPERARLAEAPNTHQLGPCAPIHGSAPVSP